MTKGERMEKMLVEADGPEIDPPPIGRPAGIISTRGKLIPLAQGPHTEAPPACRACNGKGWLYSGDPHDPEDKVECPDCPKNSNQHSVPPHKE